MILIKWSTNPTVVEPGEPPKTVAKITRLLAAQIERAARRRLGYNSHLRGGVELCRTAAPWLGQTGQSRLSWDVDACPNGATSPSSRPSSQRSSSVDVAK